MARETRSFRKAFFTNSYVVGGFATIGGGLFGLDISSMSGVLSNDYYIKVFSNPSSARQGAITASMPAGDFFFLSIPHYELQVDSSAADKIIGNGLGDQEVSVELSPPHIWQTGWEGERRSLLLPSSGLSDLSSNVQPRMWECWSQVESFQASLSASQVLSSPSINQRSPNTRLEVVWQAVASMHPFATATIGENCVSIRFPCSNGRSLGAS
jgi:hypothetical protein